MFIRVGIIATVVLLTVSAQSPTKSVEILVDDSRPLARAADQLQYKLGVPISYEDVKWIHPADLTPIGKFPGEDARRVQDQNMPVPASGRLQIRFDVDATTRNPIGSVADVLRNVLATHVGQKNPGEFRLITLEADSGFSIAPSRARNIAGSLVSVNSPLDARISFPEQDRTGEETLGAIISAIRVTTGERISLFSSLPLADIRLGAKDEIAREVLSKLLRQSYDWKAYWHLNYGPAQGYWGLNLNALYMETGNLTKDSKPEIRPVRWPGRPLVRD